MNKTCECYPCYQGEKVGCPHSRPHNCHSLLPEKCSLAGSAGNAGAVVRCVARRDTTINRHEEELNDE